MSEIIVDAVVEKTNPQQVLDIFGPLVDEVKIHWNDDGMSVRAVDAANVAMADVTLSAAAFEEYESPGAVTQGVSLESFDDRLNIANDSDLVELSLDMESRKLAIDIDNISQSMGLIDPDAIRDEPEIPDLDLPNTLVLTGTQLARVIDAVELTSDHVELVARPDRDVVEFIGEGDIDDTVVAFDSDRAQAETEIASESASLFSMDYTEKLATAIPSDTEVTIRFGDEFPMTWEWSGIDGNLRVTKLLAPRIQSR